MNQGSQTLYLLRHAYAEPWIPGQDDLARGLSRRGLRHMQQLAAWARDSVTPPGAVLCSPAARTRDSLAAMVQVWPELEAVARYVPELYEATAGTLHAIAAEAFQDAISLMVVGHNPGLELLAGAVLPASKDAKPCRLSMGTLAVIEFEDGYHAGAGAGILQHLVQRKNLSYA